MYSRSKVMSAGRLAASFSRSAVIADRFANVRTICIPFCSNSASCTVEIDVLRARRKRDITGRVLGMKMRRRDKERRSPADLRDFAQHRFAVAPAEPGIDHQGRPRSDDDADVRDEADVAVGNDVGVRRDLDCHVLADKRIRRRTALLRGRWRRGQERENRAGCEHRRATEHMAAKYSKSAVVRTPPGQHFSPARTDIRTSGFFGPAVRVCAMRRGIIRNTPGPSVSWRSPSRTVPWPAIT